MRTIIVPLVLALATVGAPVFAASPACVRCATWAINRGLHANGVVDCDAGLPRALATRLERAMQRCRVRSGCTETSAADAMASVERGVAAIEAGLCGTPACEGDGCSTPSDVLRIRCLPDDRVEVLTPVVAAGRGGVYVEALDAPPDGEVGMRALAIPNVEYWSGSSTLAEPFVRPLHTGEARVWCIRGPFQQHDPSTDEGAFTLVDTAGVFVPYALDCASGQQRDLFDDGFDLERSPSVEAAVRAFLDGIRPDDVVERAGYTRDGEWPYLTGRIVRGDRVVAAVDVDGREGWKFGADHAVVCADAGFSVR